HGKLARTTKSLSHACRWRGGRVAARGARAAGHAGDRVPRRRVTSYGCKSCARVPPRSERDRLCRGQKRCDRISLGGGAIRSISIDLVRRQVNVIAALGGTPSAQAAKAATTSIPIVFQTAVDPVEFGLIKSLVSTSE